jgi:hypothetical protein
MPTPDPADVARLIGAEQVPLDDAKEKGIANLSSRAGDGDFFSTLSCKKISSMEAISIKLRLSRSNHVGFKLIWRFHRDAG